MVNEGVQLLELLVIIRIKIGNSFSENGKAA